jgi:uncharacterized membrane protein YkoI
MSKPQSTATAVIVIALLLAGAGIALYCTGNPAGPDAVVLNLPPQANLDNQGRQSDEQVAIENVPLAVMDAVKQAVPEGKLTKAKRKTENGQPVYDLDGKAAELDFDMLIAPDGKVVELNQQIKAESLPAAVADGLKQAAPEATVKHIEKQSRGNRVIYEFKLQLAGQKLTIELSEDGAVLKRKGDKKAPATQPSRAALEPRGAVEHEE